MMNTSNPLSSCAIGRFSSLLLDVYRLSRELELEIFQRAVLERLRKEIPFDYAWWGLNEHAGATRNRLHSSVVCDLPDSYVKAWDEITADGAGARVADMPSGLTMHCSGPSDANSGPLARLLAEHDIAQALITNLENRELGLVTFLSLYRKTGAPAFTDEERIFKQNLLPHLVGARDANWLMQLDRLHARREHTALAITDSYGVLYAAQSHFGPLLRMESANWRGPQLPPAFRECIHGKDRLVGESLWVRCMPVGDLYLIELRMRSPLDSLSRRELTVAKQFSSGLSYKEIAVELRLSPTTVRHHLRTVYRKLSVSDKAKLAGMLSNL